MLFIVATKVITSRPPKRLPTGTPTARANTINAFYAQWNERFVLLKLKTLHLMNVQYLEEKSFPSVCVWNLFAWQFVKLLWQEIGSQ